MILYKNKTDTGDNNMDSNRGIGDGFGEKQLQMSNPTQSTNAPYIELLIAGTCICLKSQSRNENKIKKNQ